MAAFKASSPASSCADPMCSMFRDPRREDYTICAAALALEWLIGAIGSMPCGPVFDYWQG